MFNIIVITPEADHANETKIIESLVLNYNCTIHVRKPQYSLDTYRSYLKENTKIISNIVLHEHHSLAKEISVKGIHLKESDRNRTTEIEKDVSIISTSIHDIKDAEHLKGSFDYIFYSPLFESISKKGYGVDHTVEQLALTRIDLKKRTNIPIIGLGGINQENIALVKSSGFDGAAVLGSIWESSNPVVCFERIISNSR